MLILLATHYTLVLNPIGTPSVLAVVICGILAFLCSPWLRLPLHGRQVFIGVALVGLVYLGSMSRAFPSRPWWDADQFAAEIVYLAFGFGLSLDCLRLPSVLSRLIGAGFSYLYGGLLAFKTADVFFSYDEMWKAWVAVAVFCILWTPLAIWWGRRPRRVEATARSDLWARPAK